MKIRRFPEAIWLGITSGRNSTQKIGEETDTRRSITDRYRKSFNADRPPRRETDPYRTDHCRGSGGPDASADTDRIDYVDMAAKSLATGRGGE